MSLTVEKENHSVEHCGLMYHDYDDKDFPDAQMPIKGLGKE